jgi:hypothetical protein
MKKQLSRTKDNPLVLKTPAGTSEYTMHTEEKDGKFVLVCTVGSTELHYDARCIDNLYAISSVPTFFRGERAVEARNSHLN